MDFTKVTLKRVPKVEEKKVDLNARKKELEEQKAQLEYINKKVREADLEQWYGALKGFTYPTEFVEISVEEATVMHRLYDVIQKGDRPSPSDQLVLDALTQKLQTTMNAFPAGAFVKLSSRSAKDASVASQRTIQIFKDLLRQFPSPSDNDKLISINRAHITALCLTDAKEVIDMFISSERINSDLELALNFKESFSQHFIVRQFVPIPIQYEFRGFVVNNELKGLCQYYHFIFFPELVEKKELILNLIKKKFEELKDLVPVADKNYVIDWAIDLEKEKVYVIELNPFGDYENMGTSGAMFELHANPVLMDCKGPDRDIFFGDAPFEFRIETQEADGEKLWSLMHGPWKRLFYEMFGGPSKKK